MLYVKSLRDSFPPMEAKASVLSPRNMHVSHLVWLKFETPSLSEINGNNA